MWEVWGLVDNAEGGSLRSQTCMLEKDQAIKNRKMFAHFPVQSPYRDQVAICLTLLGKFNPTDVIKNGDC